MQRSPEQGLDEARDRLGLWLKELGAPLGSADVVPAVIRRAPFDGGFE